MIMPNPAYVPRRRDVFHTVGAEPRKPAHARPSRNNGSSDPEDDSAILQLPLSQLNGLVLNCQHCGRGLTRLGSPTVEDGAMVCAGCKEPDPSYSDSVAIHYRSRR